MPPKKSNNFIENKIRLRNSAIDNIKRIDEKINNVSHSCSIIDLQCWLEILESHFCDVQKFQSQIEELEYEPEMVMISSTRDEYENLYCEVKSKIRKLIASQSLQQTKSQVNLKTPVAVDNLPKLKLPQFSGKYSEYQNFIHLFTTMVHSNDSLSDIEKFNHLLSCLSGSALRSIKALDLSEDNYNTALDILKSRFDNKFLMCQEHIRELFSLPKVQKASPENLRALVDSISSHFNALCALVNHEDIANALIVHLALSSMDSDTQTKVQEAIDHNKPFHWSDCLKIINKRCQFLETRCNKSNNVSTEQQISQNKQNNRKMQSTSLAALNVTCGFCKEGNHELWKCSKFLELEPMARFQAVKGLSLCINCLSKQHLVKQCRSSLCKRCNERHHTLLHRENNTNSSSKQSQQQQQQQHMVQQQQQQHMVHQQQQQPHHHHQNSLYTPQQHQLQLPPSSTSLTCRLQSTAHHVEQLNSHQPQTHSRKLTILATAVVEITDKYGNKQKARALLDSASQSNFMTQHLSNLLKLEKLKTNTIIGGLGEHEICAKYSTTATIASQYTNFEASLQFIILPKITGAQPDRSIQISSWNIPQHLCLADASFNIPQQIDILIGADTFFQLLRGNQIQLGVECPTLFETELGWIVSGNCNEPTNSRSVLTASKIEQLDMGLEKLLQKFWELETVPDSIRKLSKEQTKCEELFLQNTKRLADGRFLVKLPIKQSPTILGNSMDTALRRFYSLEKRLQRDSELQASYCEFLKKYEEDGHMEPTTWPHPEDQTPCYFLPHHCVLRPDKTTTKCRVVFDASAKSSNNVSLNDILMVGPVIQSELFDVLLRFRLHRYGLMADISAMYRQILVYPEDQKLQLIVWRYRSTDALKIYKLKTVTYGTAAAPYLATRCLLQLAEENLSANPSAANIVKNDFYVDDLITGGYSLAEILKIKNEVSSITIQGQFQLRKWYSNHHEFLEKIPPDEQEKTITINNSDVVKALGIIWDASIDCFKLHYESNSNEAETLTKRKVLSELAKLFDPLGLIKPVITKAKVFMQELWIKKLGWDDNVPEPQASLWNKFVTQLILLNNLKIPRFVLQQNSICELHGFCDASTRAYGCCFYIRCTDVNGKVKVSLYTSKSKVSPISTVRSIPCLELCAAHLMTQLLPRLKKSFDFKTIFLWSDNITVLSWLKEHASHFNTFVANRVSYIQEHTVGDNWRYVPSKSNPADIISRGSTVEELTNSIWFSGPEFLYKSQEFWPSFPKHHLFEELPERKPLKTVLISSNLTSFFDTIHTTNNFIKLCKRVAYIRRFLKNCRSSTNRSTSTSIDISATEFDKAFIQIVFIVQQLHYSSEIRQLKLKQQVMPTSKLKDLNPFLEEVYGLQLLKVGGRLKHAQLPYEAKCPIILPKGNAFVNNYVQHLHIANLHAGPQALLCVIRQRFWIIGARDYARKVVRKCVHCFKYRPKMLSQIMGNLPKERVTPTKPFTHSGLDFFGPILTTSRIRGKPKYKSYVAVFVCFVTHAIHMEVVSDLTTDAFLAALKRFIGRRGLCSTLHLDNATNFVGARNKLTEFKKAFLNENYQRDLTKWCTVNNIEFKHIPPRSPHFGGLWEAAVKSAKSILYKLVQSAVLTFEELSTVIAQIEGILNSRPLTAMSSDPSDERALTPAHFLNQTNEGCIIEPAQPISKISCLKVWQQITALQQHFWKRWSREYITSLQQRHKWSTDSPNVKVGDLVLLHEDNLPPQKWVTGRVINTIPGQDGKIRVADIKSQNGVCRRAIAKLAVLPLE